MMRRTQTRSLRMVRKMRMKISKMKMERMKVDLMTLKEKESKEQRKECWPRCQPEEKRSLK